MALWTGREPAMKFCGDALWKSCDMGMTAVESNAAGRHFPRHSAYGKAGHSLDLRLHHDSTGDTAAGDCHETA